MRSEHSLEVSVVLVARGGGVKTRVTDVTDRDWTVTPWASRALSGSRPHPRTHSGVSLSDKSESLLGVLPTFSRVE